MRVELIRRYLGNPDKKNTDALLDAHDTIFWVDWRGEDDVIVEDCEAILQTGELSVCVEEIDDDPGVRFEIDYKGQRTLVPIVMGLEDRHITLCALNQAMRGEYQVRFCVASDGADTLAFLPLPASTWQELESEFGQAVGACFEKLTPVPNLFTQGRGYVSWQSLADDPTKKLEAVKRYREEHSCSLSDAKTAVENYMSKKS